jgi:hypothetical protein
MRERPPEQPAPGHHTTVLPPFEPGSPAEALDLATLEAIEQGVSDALATLEAIELGVSDALATHPDLLPETVYRAIAHERSPAGPSVTPPTVPGPPARRQGTM